MNLQEAIEMVRNSVVAMLRIHQVAPSLGSTGSAQFQVGVVGTAWCIVKNKYLVTAHHVLNNRNPRDPNDKFYVFNVPKNGPAAYHYPVVNFLLEDSQNDMAIFEINTLGGNRPDIQSCFVTFNPQYDGTHVITYGFPAPQIASVQLDQNGNWIRGDFFLKAHANEGIVSANYDIGGITHYELNVGWHHGESGGPIFMHRANIPAVFAMMQQYRNVDTPHGVMAGPHIGRSMNTINIHLRQLGAVSI